jgi:hypothetical protein
MLRKYGEFLFTKGNSNINISMWQRLAATKANNI